MPWRRLDGCSQSLTGCFREMLAASPALFPGYPSAIPILFQLASQLKCHRWLSITVSKVKSFANFQPEVLESCHHFLAPAHTMSFQSSAFSAKVSQAQSCGVIPSLTGTACTNVALCSSGDDRHLQRIAVRFLHARHGHDHEVLGGRKGPAAG